MPVTRRKVRRVHPHRRRLSSRRSFAHRHGCQVYETRSIWSSQNRRLLPQAARGQSSMSRDGQVAGPRLPMLGCDQGADDVAAGSGQGSPCPLPNRPCMPERVAGDSCSERRTDRGAWPPGTTRSQVRQIHRFALQTRQVFRPQRRDWLGRRQLVRQSAEGIRTRDRLSRRGAGASAQVSADGAVAGGHGRGVAYDHGGVLPAAGMATIGSR